MTSCYVMFNECISKLVIVCEYMVAMPNAFYESCFSNPAVKLVYLYFEILDPKNRKKKTFRDQVTGQNFWTVINDNSWFNGYFNSDFDEFLHPHSRTLYETIL